MSVTSELSTLTSTVNTLVLNSEQLLAALQSDIFSLAPLDAEPADLQQGMIVTADGVNWDPLARSGTAPYTVQYIGTSWVSLSEAPVASVDGQSGVVDLSGVYAPLSHTHVISDITGLTAALDAKADDTDLASKSDVGHGHNIIDISGLQAALDAKLETADLSGYASSSHSHLIADVTGLQAALDGKSNDGHTHGIVDISGLQFALDGKSDDGHTHLISSVTGLQTALDGKTNNGHTHWPNDIQFHHAFEDADSHWQAHFYSTRHNTADTTDAPGNHYHIVNLGGDGTARGLQLATHFGSGDVYKVRRRSDNAGAPNGAGAWQPWRTVWTDADFDPSDFLGATAQAADSALLGGEPASVSNTSNSIVQRDTSGVITCQRYRFGASEEARTTDPAITMVDASGYQRRVSVTNAKVAMSLDNIDNTSDADKPISTAVQSALDGKMSTGGGTITRNVNASSDAVLELASGGHGDINYIKYNSNVWGGIASHGAWFTAYNMWHNSSENAYWGGQNTSGIGAAIELIPATTPDGKIARVIATDAVVATDAAVTIVEPFAFYGDGDFVASGNIQGNYFYGSYLNMSHTITERLADHVFYSSTDGYVRKNTKVGFKTSLDLNNVDNTSDTDKPVSSAQQTALDGKLAKTGDTLTGPLDYDIHSMSTVIDFSQGNISEVTISGNTTFTFSNYPASGDLGYQTLKITNGGAYIITWPAGVVWDGGSAPSLQSSGTDLVTFFTDDGGTTVYGLHTYAET